MQKNVHMVLDDGFLHFYTSAFLFQLLAISYFRKKKKKDKPTARIKKKTTDQTFCSGTLPLFISSLTIP